MKANQVLASGGSALPSKEINSSAYAHMTPDMIELIENTKRIWNVFRPGPYWKLLYSLGENYEEGRVVKQDLNKAMQFYKLSAQAAADLSTEEIDSSAYAQMTPDMIELIEKTKKIWNVFRPGPYWRLLYSSGENYEEGRVVKQDFKKAVQFYKLSAQAAAETLETFSQKGL